MSQNINNVVWKACDTFRGAIDPAQYKDYILVMLFLKYLTDLRNDRLKEYKQKYAGDEVRIERAMSRDRFLLPPNSDFDYLYESRNDNKIGELINIALANIEDANKAKLEGVFRNVDFNSEINLGDAQERNARLRHLLEDFAVLNLQPSLIGNRDVIGDAYEYLIGRFAADSGKKGGEFYTPGEVSTLIARIVAPKSGDTICDPCCGSGSLLIHAAKEVSDGNVALFGQELNSGTWALCRMNMFLHGFDSADIERGDTIRTPKLIEGDALKKFNVVVANPPFSLDKWGAEKIVKDEWRRFDRGIPPKSKGDYAFISHMISIMAASDGRLGVVVPHGVLFRGGAEGKIRQKLIEENLLDGVVGLPANLFFGTGIPAALLFFNRAKQDDTVFFIDASREYEAGKNQNSLHQQNIDKIVDTWKARQSIDKYAYIARFEDLKSNDFNLSIALYIDTFEEEEEIDIAAIQREIEVLETQLTQTRVELSQALKELGYCD